MALHHHQRRIQKDVAVILISVLLFHVRSSTGFVNPSAAVFLHSPTSLENDTNMRTMSLKSTKSKLSLENHSMESSRRNVLASVSACIVLTLTMPKHVVAAMTELKPESNEEFQFQVTTTLPNGLKTEALGPQSTLVITVKPAVTYTSQVPKNVADAALSETGHWVPIVLKYQQACGSKELASQQEMGMITTTLTPDHVTPQAGTNLEWWKNLPLIVTATLEGDDEIPDLVGCRIIPNMGGIVPNQRVTMPLQRRGLCSEMMDRSKQYGFFREASS
ncbi:expressed unknown protein [Seminavis robusta]|uniref:Uncharacterized protein n=1 Tax=Seminavis robusta TaxID=568900 RepID=A0A9N8EJD3_9STRA|nr:expressed unknown protein [Seminavis robusta]|eukprot:Sro1337_g264130.1 n/a (276) ;mRNA; r:16975-17802